MNDLIISIIMGVVEGITEYIPVSSTGHLIVVGHLIGFTGERAKVYEIFIQGGAILAVLFLYAPTFLGLFDFKSTKDPQRAGFRGWDGIVKLSVGVVPVLIVGFLLHDVVKEYLFNPVSVAIALAAGGVVMLLLDNESSQQGKSTIASLSLKECFIVGISQCLALWPGVSRSGATIIGGLMLGFERRLAAEFSFVLAVPVLSAAVIYDLYKNRSILSVNDVVFFAEGFFISFIVAIIAIKFMLSIIQSHSFRPFAIYRIIFGIVVLMIGL